MNKTAFTRLIQNSLSISDADMQALEQVVQAFPYCHVAHMLLAKASHDKASMMAPQRLRKAAIHAPSRTILKKLIESAPETERQSAYSKILSVHEPAEINTAASTADVHVLVPDYQDELEDLIENDFPENETELIHQKDSTSEAQILPFQVQENKPLIDTAEETGLSEADPDFELPEETEKIELSEIPALTKKPEESDIEKNNYNLVSSQSIIQSQEPEELPGIEAEDFNFAPQSSGDQDLDLPEAKDGIVSVDNSEEEVEKHDQEEALLAPHQEAAIEGDTSTVTGSPFSEIELKSREEAEIILQGLEAVAITPNTEEAMLVHPEELILEEPVASLAFREAADAKISASVDQIYADDLIRTIFRESELGYAMSSSRLGECLQVKSELTTEVPFHFQPELLVEYNLTKAGQTKTEEKAIIAQQDIINDFLKQASKGRNRINQAAKAEEQEDLSSKSTKLGKSLVSENLAQIFAMQGKNKKAIKIYQQLMLKIPEKKDYFAAQIVKLQNI